MNHVVRLKNRDDISRIKESGLIIYHLFKKIGSMNLDGISTWELDSFIDDYILKNKARPAFKTIKGYSFASCISVNHVASHGMPSRKKKISSGDIVKIDTGTVMNGYFADSCSTFMVGHVSENAEKLVNAAYCALRSGIGEILPGKYTGDIGYAVENSVRGMGYSVVKNFTGHGVGFALHEAPVVPSCGMRGRGTAVISGMVLTVEPIVNEGTDELVVQADGWTSVTKDGMLSAQFEHTVAVTDNGPVILTSL